MGGRREGGKKIGQEGKHRYMLVIAKFLVFALGSGFREAYHIVKNKQEVKEGHASTNSKRESRTDDYD